METGAFRPDGAIGGGGGVLRRRIVRPKTQKDPLDTVERDKSMVEVNGIEPLTLCL